MMYKRCRVWVRVRVREMCTMIVRVLWKVGVIKGEDQCYCG